MRLSSLFAYDAAGTIIAGQDMLRWRSPSGKFYVVDFEAHETEALHERCDIPACPFRPGKLRDIWEVNGAAGSATWPEWLGSQAADFRVEVDRRHSLPLRRLVHLESGYVRDRADIERAIAVVEDTETERIRAGGRGPRVIDLRAILGGPERSLLLDENGRTRPGAQRDGEGLAQAVRGQGLAGTGASR